MSLASDEFNSLPFETRKRLHGVLLETRINQAKIDRKQVIAAKDAAVRKIDAHIKNLEDELRRWQREHDPAPTP